MTAAGCCSATTRPTPARLFGGADSPAFPKDGINDHVVAGAPTVNPEGTGTKCAAWYQLMVEPGQTQVVRVRLRPPATKPAFGKTFDKVMADARSARLTTSTPR